jgi:hypothetical protein
MENQGYDVSTIKRRRRTHGTTINKRKKRLPRPLQSHGKVMQAITVKLMSDNVPGLKHRYFLQEVSNAPELPICVAIDGQCNHADSDREYDEGWFSRCAKCDEVLEEEL